MGIPRRLVPTVALSEAQERKNERRPRGPVHTAPIFMSRAKLMLPPCLPLPPIRTKELEELSGFPPPPKRQRLRQPKRKERKQEEAQLPCRSACSTSSSLSCRKATKINEVPPTSATSLGRQVALGAAKKGRSSKAGSVAEILNEESRGFKDLEAERAAEVRRLARLASTHLFLPG
jgi:hypothetical protein